MLESVVLDPFEGNIFYGQDTQGDNVYFRILAVFEYQGHAYDVYQYTTDDAGVAYIGEIFVIEEENGSVYNMSVPLEEGELFFTVRDLWTAYVEALPVDDESAEEEEEQ